MKISKGKRAHLLALCERPRVVVPSISPIDARAMSDAFRGLAVAIQRASNAFCEFVAHHGIEIASGLATTDRDHSDPVYSNPMTRVTP